MSRSINYFLAIAALTTFLWTGTFLHDFCESLPAGGMHFNHHGLISHSHDHSFAAPLGSIEQGEEHSHQPSMVGNHSASKLANSESANNPNVFIALQSDLWQLREPITLNSRQRPPPRAGPHDKIPVFLLYQVLLI
ncbi:MAG: hypothetical protein K8F91_22715 [Candidatus Obscuribacterales bacterium]|nr:hypothetical protein [Candidatus Obscuribacterales bacterium]